MLKIFADHGANRDATQPAVERSNNKSFDALAQIQNLSNVAPPPQKLHTRVLVAALLFSSG